MDRGLILGRGFVPVPSSFAVKSLGLGVRELKIQSFGFGVQELKNCKNVELYAALRITYYKISDLLIPFHCKYSLYRQIIVVLSVKN